MLSLASLELKLSWTYLMVKILILANFTTISAQKMDQNFVFKNITLMDGLSHSTVRSVTKDAEGYIWIGTLRGLDRYDGISFDHLNLPEGEDWQAGTIIKLFGSKDAHLWIGTTTGCLSYKNKIKK